jgi:hypothetical protein
MDKIRNCILSKQVEDDIYSHGGAELAWKWHAPDYEALELVKADT